MNRRRFLIKSSQAGLAAAITQMLPLPLYAAYGRSSKFKNLITVHFDQGWDVTLGLDPQVKPSKVSDRECFLGYSADQIIPGANLKFGPAAKALAPYASNCIVINGVSMNGNISHPDSTRFAQTGIVDRSVPQLVVLKSFVEQDSNYGARVMQTGYTRLEFGDLPVDVYNVGQIRNLILNDGQALDDALEEEGYIAKYNRSTVAFSELLKKKLSLKPEWATMIQASDQNYRSLDEGSARSLALALQSGFITGAHLLLSPSTGGSLDTHNDHKRDHAKFQADCWNQVLNLVKALQDLPGANGSSSVFDETLIMVTSDFSRETMLNSGSVESAGKEHNGYTNSFLLMGGSLRGGYSIGESIVQFNYHGRPSMHTSRNFDFRSGKVIREFSDAPDFLSQDEIKTQIQPGHVIRTLATLFGAESLLDPMLQKLPRLMMRA